MLYENILKEGFDLNTLQLQKFKLYYFFLKEYTVKINLTALTTEQHVYLKHFYDSLLVSRVFDFQTIDSLCDLGTGAGFPGIPLKILFPHLKLFLIESCTKKYLFLQKLVTVLDLCDVYCFNQRIEEHIAEYPFIIARALSKLNLILKLAAPLTQDRGYFVAMKGPNYQKELDQISKIDFFILKQKFFAELPNKLGKRTNLLFQKK